MIKLVQIRRYKINNFQGPQSHPTARNGLIIYCMFFALIPIPFLSDVCLAILICIDFNIGRNIAYLLFNVMKYVNANLMTCLMF